MNKIFVLVVLFCSFVFSSGIVFATTYVDSCTVISSPGHYVLSGNIVGDSHEPCILIESDHVSLDLNSNTIFSSSALKTYYFSSGISVSGVSDVNISGGSVSGFYYGVIVDNSSNVGISDVNIFGSKQGLFLNSSNYVSLEGLDISSCSVYGVHILDSSHIDMGSSNTVSDNGAFDVYLYASNMSFCQNNLSDITLTNNKKLKYVHNVADVTLDYIDISDYYEYLFCGLSNVTIKNIQLVEEDSGDDVNGVVLVRSHNITLDNLFVNNMRYGFYGLSNRDVFIKDCTFKNSDVMDVYIYSENKSFCDYTFSNVKGAWSRPILFYNNDNLLLENLTYSDFIELVVCGSDNFILRNISHTWEKKEGNSILISQCNNGVLEDIDIHYFRYGTFVVRSSNITIKDSDFGNVFRGVRVKESEDIFIFNNTFSDSSYGIYVQDSTDVSSYDNFLSNMDYHGIYYYIGSEGGSIYNNVIEDCGVYGIYYWGDNTNIFSNQVNNSERGIYLYRSSNAVVHSNSFNNNDLYGLFVAQGCHHNISSNNSVNGRDILYYHDTSNIDLHDIDNEYSQIIFCNVTNASIHNLVISDGYGLFVHKLFNSSIFNNSFYNNSRDMFVDFSWNNKIYNNNLLSSSQYPVFFYNSHYNSFYNNHLYSVSGVSVCYLGYGSSHNTLYSNTFVSGSDSVYSLRLYDTHNCTFRDNIFFGDFKFSDTSYNLFYNNIINGSVVFGSSLPNSWNTVPLTGMNIVGGLVMGGNYWVLPDGSGFGESCLDANRDGICDSGLDLFTMSSCVPGLNCSSNSDYFPLTKVLSSYSGPALPIASVGVNKHLPFNLDSYVLYFPHPFDIVDWLNLPFLNPLLPYVFKFEEGSDKVVVGIYWYVVILLLVLALRWFYDFASHRYFY